MYGYLMSHQGKGPTRPAGGVTPRALPLQEDVLSARSPAVGLRDGLPAMRGHAPTAAFAVSQAPAAVLEPTRREEEGAATFLRGKSSGYEALLGPAKVHVKPLYIRKVSARELLTSMAAAAPQLFKPMELEAVRGDALPVVRNKRRLVSSASAAKRPKMRRFADLLQTPPNPAPAADATEVEPPQRRIPSPASDRKYVCRMCGMVFPTHYALGGHVSSHNKVSKLDLAAAHVLHNIVAQHHQRQKGGGRVVPGAARGLSVLQNIPPPLPARRDLVHYYRCSRCTLVFRCGRALGGHMGMHRNEEREHMDAVAAVAAASPAAQAAAAAGARPVVPPRDFDLNELPREE